jgi:hypothetical protein
MCGTSYIDTLFRNRHLQLPSKRYLLTGAPIRAVFADSISVLNCALSIECA